MAVPTPHLSAAAGDYADAVLLPGDPLRAQVIAEELLDGARCVNRVRNMLGFTGTYRGRAVSVQGTGMGMPSLSIYATELLRFHGVRTAIRVGSCGAIREEVALRDVVVASAAHTNSAMNRQRFPGVDFAPAADVGLLVAAMRLGTAAGLRLHAGPVLTSDAFYDDDEATMWKLARHGTLAVEMECAALYTIAAAEGARALCIATVSDHLVHHEAASSQEREQGFLAMAHLALDVIAETA
jgi:purine-nucleoside phosphorylase